MIDRTHELPLVRQCQILELSCSTAYYRPVPVSPDELALMRRIDELHLNRPFAGARMLKRAGQPVFGIDATNSCHGNGRGAVSVMVLTVKIRLARGCGAKLI